MFRMIGSHQARHLQVSRGKSIQGQGTLCQRHPGQYMCMRRAFAEHKRVGITVYHSAVQRLPGLVYGSVVEVKEVAS